MNSEIPFSRKAQMAPIDNTRNKKKKKNRKSNEQKNKEKYDKENEYFKIQKTIAEDFKELLKKKRKNPTNEEDNKKLEEELNKTIEKIMEENKNELDETINEILKNQSFYNKELQELEKQDNEFVNDLKLEEIISDVKEKKEEPIENKDKKEEPIENKDKKEEKNIEEKKVEEKKVEEKKFEEKKIDEKKDDIIEKIEEHENKNDLSLFKKPLTIKEIDEIQKKLEEKKKQIIKQDISEKYKKYYDEFNKIKIDEKKEEEYFNIKKKDFYFYIINPNDFNILKNYLLAVFKNESKIQLEEDIKEQQEIKIKNCGNLIGIKLLFPIVLKKKLFWVKKEGKYVKIKQINNVFLNNYLMF